MEAGTMMIKYLWWCLSDNETAADARSVKATTPAEAARSAADVNHGNGAYESDWPRRYAVQATSGDRKVRLFDIDREYVPVFDELEVRGCRGPGCRQLSEMGSHLCRQCNMVAYQQYCAARAKEQR